MALEALNDMIEAALERGSLKGIRFEEDNLHLAQQFFADNTNMLLVVEVENVKECQRIFDEFGRAPGLKCDWNGTGAVYIGEGPIPDEWLQFPWQWENEGSYSKLLGRFFGPGISHAMSIQQLKAKLEKLIA